MKRGSEAPVFFKGFNFSGSLCPQRAEFGRSKHLARSAGCSAPCLDLSVAAGVLKDVMLVRVDGSIIIHPMIYIFVADS